MDTSRKYELTPVQNIDGLWFKRDDLFAPFGLGSVNGGKLRQCFMLVDKIKDKYDGVISCCSIHSPQAPITSAVANYFDLPCYIYYGGTSKKSLLSLDMPRIALEYGAKVTIASKSGRHNILYSKARDFAKKNNLFVVEYGFNIVDYADLLLKAISIQVQNIPDELDNLIITCGSGITTIGVLLGINKYQKRVKNIHLVATAPDRSKLIKDTLEKYNIKRDVIIHDLFHRKGFVYEKGIKVIYHGIELHPNYEAKTFSWLYNESGIDIHNNKNLLWVVGSKPRPNRKR